MTQIPYSRVPDAVAADLGEAAASGEFAVERATCRHSIERLLERPTARGPVVIARE